MTAPTPEQKARIDLARERRKGCEPTAFKAAHEMLAMLADQCNPRLTDPLWEPIKPDRVQIVMLGVMFLLEIASGNWRAK